VEEYGARKLFLAAAEELAHVLESRERYAQRADRARDGSQPKYQIEVPEPRRSDDSRNDDCRQQCANERNHHFQAHEDKIAPDELGIAGGQRWGWKG